MRELRNVLYSNLLLLKFSTYWNFRHCFLHLIFRYLNAARDFIVFSCIFWAHFLRQLAKYEQIFPIVFSVVPSGKKMDKHYLLYGVLQQKVPFSGTLLVHDSKLNSLDLWGQIRQQFKIIKIYIYPVNNRTKGSIIIG